MMKKLSALLLAAILCVFLLSAMAEEDGFPDRSGLAVSGGELVLASYSCSGNSLGNIYDS